MRHEVHAWYAIKMVPEVCRIFSATPNLTEVVLAATDSCIRLRRSCNGLISHSRLCLAELD